MENPTSSTPAISDSLSDDSSFDAFSGEDISDPGGGISDPGDRMANSIMLEVLISRALDKYKQNKFGIFSLHGKTGLKRIAKIENYISYLEETRTRYGISTELPSLVILWSVIHCAGETISQCFCEEIANKSRENIYFKNIDKLKEAGKYSLQKNTPREFMLIEDIVEEKLKKMMLLRIPRNDPVIKSIIVYLDDPTANIDYKSIESFVKNIRSD